MARVNTAIKDKQIQPVQTSSLLLDIENPRFGEHINPKNSTQKDILNLIVNQFGVDDVLSSISVSGYFSAEPLVCKETDDGKYIVIEGNRRLAAILILADDERAIDHTKRHAKFKKIHLEHDEPLFDPVPSIIFNDHDNNESLLSYLGVRHIVSTKEWDSFAKAAWVAKALDTSKLSLADIAEMIGDTRSTIQKMLSGYHFIKNAQEKGYFYPENSMRKGRGSNTQYPFSWVYTILGSPTVRNYIELSNNPENPEPIPEKNLEKAELVINSMFGNSNKGLSPAIGDSRELKELAKVFSSPDKVEYLRLGKTVKEIDRLTKPLDELLGGALVEVLDKLREVNGRLSEDEIPSDMAASLLRNTTAIKKQADNINSHMLRAANPE